MDGSAAASCRQFEYQCWRAPLRPKLLFSGLIPLLLEDGAAALGAKLQIRVFCGIIRLRYP